MEGESTSFKYLIPRSSVIEGPRDHSDITNPYNQTADTPQIPKNGNLGISDRIGPIQNSAILNNVKLFFLSLTSIQDK